VVTCRPRQAVLKLTNSLEKQDKCLIQHNFAGCSKFLWITMLKNPWMRAKTLADQAFCWIACFQSKAMKVNEINDLRAFSGLATGAGYTSAD
jgi:hypothetical protein